MLEALKTAIVLLFLVYASYLDLKSRIVPNKVWKYMLIAASPITVFQILEQIYAPSPLILKILPFLLMIFAVLFFLLLYKLGMYGGADAKALICLSILFSNYPSIEFFPLGFKGLLFSISTLANAVFIAPFIVLAFFVRNFISHGLHGFLKNPFYYFVGYKISIDRVKFHNLFEIVDESGKLKKLKRAVEADEKILEQLKKSGIKEVWVTPALPFIVFITFGYILAVVYGDIIFAILAMWQI